LKPTLFIGSSVEGLDLAYAAQTNLHDSVEVTVWTQGVFTLSKTSLESLLAILDRIDFGMFVFSPDDITTIRGEQNPTVRDNVLFELGLFVGRLGRERSFILIPGNASDLHLPTDLIGIAPATYEVGRSDGSVQAAMGPASHAVRETIKRIGPRSDQAQSPSPGPEPSEQAIPEISSRTEPTETTVEQAKIDQPSKYEWLQAYVNKDYSQSIALLEEQITSLPEGDERDDLEAWRERAQYHIDPSVGTQRLEELIFGRPHSSHAYTHLAFAHLSRDLLNEALKVFDRGLAAATSKGELILGKVGILKSIGRTDQAIELLRRAIADDPGNPPYYQQLSEILKSKGEREEALEALEKGLMIVPGSENLLLAYAQEISEGVDKKLALIPYNKLVGLNPKNPSYLTLRGNLCLELNLPGEAMRCYKAANILAEEKQAWVLGNIGNLYKNCGLHSDAVEYLKKSLLLDPDDDYAHQRLGQALELRRKENEQLDGLTMDAYRILSTRKLAGD